MATLAVQEAPRNSVLASTSFSAVAASDTFPNSGDEVVMVENSNAASRTITVAPGGSGVDIVGDGSLASIQAVSGFTIVANTGRSFIGRLDRSKFGDSPVITASATAGVSLAVVKVG